MFPPGVQIPEQLAIGALKHNICEYSNLKAVLPQMYAEFGQAIP